MRPFLLLLALATTLSAAPDTTKPWTRWWWLGSGVDDKNLTRQLEAFAQAGIGGVEICPIYGAKGYEDRNLEFLSEEWTAALAHTSRECERLGLGLDLTTGTGWPFGGPWVTDEMASHALTPVKQTAKPGPLRLTLPKGDPVCLRAYPEDGGFVDLLPMVREGTLTWTVPEGGCRILGLVTRSQIQKVKRAAPGGAGHVVDPFSPESLERYLARFDQPLTALDAPQPRAHFHDSFEYYNAAWTPGFLETFRQRHGYDLREQLPAFLGEGDPDTVARVAHDYRSTLDHLHHAYLQTWNAWAGKHGSLTRNQAHGSPGSLLDHYAVADIPETEIFRQVDDPQIPMLQFAASAAHLTDRKLVSAESFTWLGEHFQVTPAALKKAADFLWLGGVNHLFFHGIPYSPEEAGWPGWLFYASTHMGENGGLWRDLPAFSSYIANVQETLQSGHPDTAVLLYFPVHDLWSQPAENLPLFTIHNQDQWLHGSSFHRAAMTLWENGIPCDFVSDRLLQGLTCEDGTLKAGGLTFKTLVVPELDHLPQDTATRLHQFANQGASIAFLGEFSDELPGLAEGSPDAPKLLAHLPHSVKLLPHLAALGINPEPMSAHGLRFVRRVTDDGGTAWFLVNHTDEPLDRWLPLSVPFEAAVFTDPSDATRSGVVTARDGRLRFVMGPRESRLLHTFPKPPPTARNWIDWQPAGDPRLLGGPWQVTFLDGGPVLPDAARLDSLRSWTTLGDPARAFSGTARYTTSFDAPPGEYLLDLGTVAETCRVTLNGRPLGRSFFPGHRFNLATTPKGRERLLKRVGNVLQVEVTNLAANRIADLDRRGVNWKAFHEINFVNIDYQPFDASGWEPLPSGLLGPVQLIPIRPR